MDQKRFFTALGGGALAIGFIAFFIIGAVLALLSVDVGAQSESIFSPYVLSILRFTLYQAVLSTVLSVGFAIPVALALARQPQFLGRIWIIRLFAVPMGLPVIVGTLGIISIWGNQGLVNQLWMALGGAKPISIYGLSGILLAHVFFNLPLAARLLLAALERIPGEYWRTVAALGMKPSAIFRLIEWPAMRSAIVSSATLIFMLCLTSFTIVLLLGGGPAASTVEVAIYQALRFDFDPQRAISLALIQIGLTLGLLFLTSLVPQAQDDVRSVKRLVRRFDGLSLSARFKDGLSIVVTILFVASPLVSVIVSGVSANIGQLLSSAIFVKALTTSFVIAISAALMTLVITLLISQARYTIAQNRRAGAAAKLFRGVLGLTPSLVLLVPPVVIGSGWFLLLLSFGDVSVYAPFLVAFINMLVSLPFVMRVVEPAVESYRQRTDRLSESLGVNGFSNLRLIAWPVLRRTLAMAMSFSMALSLGDLGAVALFGSDDFVTLPWLVYSNMGAYRSNDAAGYALILGVICLLLAVYGAGQDKAATEREGNANG